MSESKHTPGPWHVVPTGEGSQHGPTVTIDSNPLKIIARPDWHGIHDEYMANAFLIAAAPTMFNVLELIATGVVAEHKIVELCTKAIAKAKGET